MTFELAKSTPERKASSKSFTVPIDAIPYTVTPPDKIVLNPGQSITLFPDIPVT